MTTSSVLGINFGLHDSSCAVLRFEEGKIVSASVRSSERVTRKKHQGLFPYLALKELKTAFPEDWLRLSPEAVALNAFGPSPQEFEEEIRSKNDAHDDLILAYGLELTSFRTNPAARALTHHICHAYSALIAPPFSRALVVVVDGMGNLGRVFPPDHSEARFALGQERNFEFLSVYGLDGPKLTPFEKMFSPLSFEGNRKRSLSPGALFENASTLIFGDWTQAGKVMGLSAHGKPKRDFSFTQLQNHLLEVSLPQEFKDRADLAATVQFVFEEWMLRELRRLRKAYPEFENLILVGGCALNCVLNDRLRREGLFQRVFVPPWPNDEGIALGAALALAHEKNLWHPGTPRESGSSPFLGTELRADDRLVEFPGVKKTKLPSLHAAAQFLEKGKILAWAHGKAEVGPRALGHRSILVRADLPGIKDRLNQTIKFRENFRPYGVSVLKESVADFFEVTADADSPFMTFAPRVKTQHRKLLEEVTQPDGTCRIQTVTLESFPELAELLESLKELGAPPILLHTSMNVMGEPICETSEDVFRFFEKSAVDGLVLGDWLFEKDSP